MLQMRARYDPHILRLHFLNLHSFLKYSRVVGQSDWLRLNLKLSPQILLAMHRCLKRLLIIKPLGYGRLVSLFFAWTLYVYALLYFQRVVRVLVFLLLVVLRLVLQLQLVLVLHQPVPHFFQWVRLLLFFLFLLFLFLLHRFRCWWYGYFLGLCLFLWC